MTQYILESRSRLSIPILPHGRRRSFLKAVIETQAIDKCIVLQKVSLLCLFSVKEMNDFFVYFVHRDSSAVLYKEERERVFGS